MRPRRVLALAVLAGVTIAVTPATAWADAAGPTNFRSTVTGAPSGVTAEVVGGDSFLRVRAHEGREVLVFGYENEPWLWIRDDGMVLRNTRSPATYLNQDRYADVEPPPTADADAEPEWEEIDDDGEWAWHDHRIHWMSPDDPPAVRDGAGGPTQIFTWEIAVEVDGEPAAVQGELMWLPGENPLPWLALGLVGAAPLVLLRRQAEVVLVLSQLAAAGLALALGIGELADQPAGAAGTPLPIILPAVTLAFAVAGTAAVWRSRGLGQTFALAAVVTLVPWVFLRLGVLSNPILPTTFPEGVDRVGTAAIAWVLLVSIIFLVRGFLRATSTALDAAEHA